MSTRKTRLRQVATVLPFLLAVPALAQAQGTPSRAEARAALAPAPSGQTYTNAQLDQMLAPIALYPDQLLVQVLMAATYSDQLQDAEKWLQDSNNASLQGDALVQALAPLPWDPSVKSLCAFPQVIALMNAHPDWTAALGYAFANQQVLTMARVQALRDQALAAGKLNHIEHLKVVHHGRTIVIEPAEPNEVYVPVYNPAVVYGTWREREHPPVYLPPPPGFAGPAGQIAAAGIVFGAARPVVAPLWGWSRPDWTERRVTIERTEYVRINRDHAPPRQDVWRHEGPIVNVIVRPDRPPEGREPGREPRRDERAGERPPGTAAPTIVVLPQRPDERFGQRPSPDQRPASEQPWQDREHGDREHDRDHPPGAAATAPQPGPAPGNDHEHPAAAAAPQPGPAPGNDHQHPAAASTGPQPGPGHGPEHERDREHDRNRSAVEAPRPAPQPAAAPAAPPPAAASQPAPAAAHPASPPAAATSQPAPAAAHPAPPPAPHEEHAAHPPAPPQPHAPEPAAAHPAPPPHEEHAAHPPAPPQPPHAPEPAAAHPAPPPHEEHAAHPPAPPQPPHAPEPAAAHPAPPPAPHEEHAAHPPARPQPPHAPEPAAAHPAPPPPAPAQPAPAAAHPAAPPAAPSAPAPAVAHPAPPPPHPGPQPAAGPGEHHGEHSAEHPGGKPPEHHPGEPENKDKH